MLRHLYRLKVMTSFDSHLLEIVVNLHHFNIQRIKVRACTYMYHSSLEFIAWSKASELHYEAQTILSVTCAGRLAGVSSWKVRATAPPAILGVSHVPNTS